jgi:hypothetical protein
MMRLRFWIQLPRLSFGICNEKIKILYKSLIFLKLYRPMDRGWTEAQTRAASFFHVGTAPTWCGSGSGSNSDAYPLAYTVKKSKVWYKFLIFSLYKSKDRSWRQSQNGAASCWRGSNIKIWCGSVLAPVRPLYFGLYSEKIKDWNHFYFYFFTT